MDEVIMVIGRGGKVLMINDRHLFQRKTPKLAHATLVMHVNRHTNGMGRSFVIPGVKRLPELMVFVQQGLARDAQVRRLGELSTNSGASSGTRQTRHIHGQCADIRVSRGSRRLQAV
jgi:hypothetical protein